jgi:hypothetical protein
MRTSFRVAAVAAALVLLLPIVPVEASSGLSVHFDIQTTIVPGFAGGPFTAIGPAVDNGLVCSTGDTVDVSVEVTGGGPKGVAGYHVLKSFTCANETGSFLLKLEVRSSPSRGGTYSWTVVGGTYQYANLRGSGTGYSVPADYGVNDQLFGSLH